MGQFGDLSVTLLHDEWLDSFFTDCLVVAIFRKLWVVIWITSPWTGPPPPPREVGLRWFPPELGGSPEMVDAICSSMSLVQGDTDI